MNPIFKVFVIICFYDGTYTSHAITLSDLFYGFVIVFFRIQTSFQYVFANARKPLDFASQYFSLNIQSVAWYVILVSPAFSSTVAQTHFESTSSRTSTYHTPRNEKRTVELIISPEPRIDVFASS